MDAFIFDHVRTPRGKGRPDGALHEVTPLRLASQVLSALRERNRLDPSLVDDVGLGVVMPLGEQGADLTRFALLDAGYGDSVPGFQVNRFCTSGLDAVNAAAAAVASGQARAAIGGGVESMSRVAIGSDGGPCYTDPDLTRRYPYMPNGVAADLMATLEGVTREECDAFAAESQRRAARARDNGFFRRSLIGVRDVIGNVLLESDEAIRAATTEADLARLKPAFAGVGEHGFDTVALQRYPHLEALEHIHTSGNSSAIVDGACAVLIGNQSLGAISGLRPRARIRAFATVASEPRLSLGGPVPASDKVLQRAGMAIGDIDLFEINEAFSVVPIAYMRRLGISHDRLNVNGGAIAMGHPLGATGAMLLGTVLDELERRDLATALVTLCAAAGQATATIIERV